MRINDWHGESAWLQPPKALTIPHSFDCQKRMMPMEDYQTKLHAILKCAKQAAIAYYDLTGKPLGITGEIGEYESSPRIGTPGTP